MPFHTQTGLSLIELLIVLGVMAILSHCAIGYLLPTLSKAPIQHLSDEILHHLKYARTEAIKRHQIVTLCGTQDFKTCHPDWKDGYLIFTSHPLYPDKKEMIHIQAQTNHKIVLSADFNHPDNKIQFTAQGHAKNNGSIVVQSKSSDMSQTIVISLTGRSRLI